MLIRTPLTILLLVLLATAALPSAGNRFAVSAQTPQKQQRKQAGKVNLHTCPMHPEVTSTRRRKCLKCGMTLRLVKDESQPAAPSAVSTPTLPPASGETASISSTRIPDVDVYDQNGKRLKFWSDLIKGKTVAILKALGTAVATKTDHTPMILIGNDLTGYWTRAYGLSSPTHLMKVIAEVATSK